MQQLKHHSFILLISNGNGNHELSHRLGAALLEYFHGFNRRLYSAISSGGGGEVSDIIAGDLDWWFHGPQKCDYMMKKLTGKSSSSPWDFKFEPRHMDAVDDHVIVEGWEGAEVYWVHVWTLKDGVITHFREYFNTWLTVRDFSCSVAPLWQSHPQQRSLPGLMLAI